MSRAVLHRPVRSIAWTGSFLALLGGCRESGPAVVPEFDTGPLVAETADVRVVTDSAPLWGDASQWTVADEPTLDLGGPEQTFLGVAPVLRLSDGRIVVADGSQQTIRYFDGAGKLLLTIGGRATEVDGGFHGLGWIGRGADDMVVAFDFVARRLVVLDGKGNTTQAAVVRPADPSDNAEPLTAYPDGSVLFRVGGANNPFQGAPGAVVRDSASYVRFALDGTPQASFGVFPQSESFGVTVRQGAPPASFPVPFGLATYATLRGDSMLIGTGASFEIATIGPDGRPTGLLRATIPRQEVTPEDASAYTAAALTRLRTGARDLQADLDSNFIRAIERAPFPRRMPAFSRLLVDRTGALWVSAPIQPPADPTSWNVFAADGAWLGSVTTPVGFRIDEIGEDYLLGVWRQTHGQERVRIYPLSRATGP